MTRESRPRNFSIYRILAYIFFIGIIAAGGLAYYGYQQIFSLNVNLKEGKTTWLYIPKGATYEDLLDSFKLNNILKNNQSFDLVANQKNLANHIHPGRYEIKAGMNNNELINKLRAGQHSPVDVTFNYLRTMEDLAGRISRYLYADSLGLVIAFKDADVQDMYGFTKETFPSMFIPNTYKFNWSTTSEEFVKRMSVEYERFWKERKAKAEAINLTPNEVVALASIVQAETAKADERQRIAGVYMNRLEQDIPLQADPTLIFAFNDFSIRRVLNKHKKIDSPYNTYKYPGIPPGPINFPEITYVDAVLDYERHEYIFFCAREDFSGYSNFAKTNAQHERNAKKYRAALNKRKIYR